MLIKSSRLDVDLVGDTGPTDWDVFDLDHSSREAHAVESGGGVRASAERELPAAHVESLCREADKAGLKRNAERSSCARVLQKKSA